MEARAARNARATPQYGPYSLDDAAATLPPRCHYSRRCHYRQPHCHTAATLPPRCRHAAGAGACRRPAAALPPCALPHARLGHPRCRRRRRRRRRRRPRPPPLPPSLPPQYGPYTRQLPASTWYVLGLAGTRGGTRTCGSPHRRLCSPEQSGGASGARASWARSRTSGSSTPSISSPPATTSSTWPLACGASRRPQAGLPSAPRSARRRRRPCGESTLAAMSARNWGATTFSSSQVPSTPARRARLPSAVLSNAPAHWLSASGPSAEAGCRLERQAGE